MFLYVFIQVFLWIIMSCREIEKLKLSEMTCKEGVIEVAKM